MILKCYCRKLFHVRKQLHIVRALRALPVLAGPSQPALRTPSTPCTWSQEPHFSSGWGSQPSAPQESQSPSLTPEWTLGSCLQPCLQPHSCPLLLLLDGFCALPGLGSPLAHHPVPLGAAGSCSTMTCIWTNVLWVTSHVSGFREQILPAFLKVHHTLLSVTESSFLYWRLYVRLCDS